MRALAPVVLLTVLLASACTSGGPNGGEDNPYQADDSFRYADTQISLIPPGGGSQKDPPIVLINRTHKKYLKSEDGVSIPKYSHPYFSKNRFTAWAVMPNQDMKILIDDSLAPEGLFDLGTPIDLATMSRPKWPERWALVLEQGDRMLVVYDPMVRGADGRAVDNRVAPGSERALKLIITAKQCLIPAINAYPGVNQMTERGGGDGPRRNPGR